MTAIDEHPAAPETDMDLAAVQGEIADVLDGDSDRAARKALLQTLIAEVRVESREAITPSCRVALEAPARVVSGLAREEGLEPSNGGCNVSFLISALRFRGF